MSGGGAAAPRTTLPRIQLPQFFGKYEDWPSFRDLFQSIIGKDTSLAPVEKMHYLKASLKGEAELLIRSLATTGENFDSAWRTLTKQFENKRLLVRSYLSQLDSLQKLKGESASDLRRLWHCVRGTVDSLASIDRPISRSADYFIHSVIELLDSRSRREWESYISETTEPPTYAELERFLERRLQTLESIQPIKGDAGNTNCKPISGPTRQTRSLHAKSQGGRPSRCSLCSKDHHLMFCDAYQAKTSDERKQYVTANKLCPNCLGRHKLTECASRRTCTTCGERHHSTMHDAYQKREIATTSHISRPTPDRPVAVLLATARVRVADRFGRYHIARALIDQGSESSLISESLAQLLRLPRHPTEVAIFGVGGVQTGRARGLVHLQITPFRGGAPMTTSALVFPQLTIYDGNIGADPRGWIHLSGLELADPDYLTADPVDLLLGADVYGYILRDGILKGGSQDPKNDVSAEVDLTSLVRRFWQQEELPVAAPAFTPEDQKCEDLFVRTHSRSSDGRYIVRLPVIDPLPDFSSTRISAVRVLTGMEKRFVQDGRLHQLYLEFMSQYEDLGHMTSVDQKHVAGERVSYLPHHGVWREASVTTKLRVVFNGSTATTSGQSLNQCLMVGPNLLPPLAEVLLRWRQHRYVLATDVEKMYRQIQVHDDDRDLQRIVWRYKAEDELRIYRLNTVTYGLACAPFLAMRTLRQLADDECEQFPVAASVLRRDVYMDDILTGADELDETYELQRQLTGLCMAGGFPLRKWAANHLAVLKSVPAEHQMQREPRAWHPHEIHSTLGLHWHPRSDDFSFAMESISVSVFTKRSVLSLTARLFDPLGWLAPTVVSAKIAFQSTWLQGLDWDAPLDEKSALYWRTFQDELPLLKSVRIPRWLGLFSYSSYVELHGFADASQRAFAAVVYLRTGAVGAWQTGLVAAKTKVAPTKPVTLPRLELCAAALLTRLVSSVRKTFGLQQVQLHCWTDSTVTLGWIRGHPTRWTTYVANRIADIQVTAPDAQWHHVPGRENPADCASRGLLPGELVNFDLWWRGPSWLTAEVEPWPALSSLPDTGILPEERVWSHTSATSAATLDVAEEADELLRFSSLHRLMRVTSWCRRWLRVRKTRGSEPSVRDQATAESPLTAAELETARLTWVRLTQTIKFKDELKTLQRGQPLKSSNRLAGLSPFTDPQGILRLGGRLKHSLLAFEEKHPAILPHDSHFTRLVVEACHQRSLHGGVQLTLGLIRQRYWIPRGRSLVKRIILSCVTCVRWRAATPQQLMGDLPPERVTPARSFHNTGVDYAGPVQLRTTRGRGHKAYKAFIAVFVCFSTRAVHLEVVSDYTAEAFLAALRQFVSRRGLCSTLWSDCGTNFVGADRQLRALFAACNPERRRILDELASQGIQWRFNPPAAPHFGGIWEAAVKSCKHHLRRVVGDMTLTYEEMATFLAQVEACLNSRPLQALSDDPDDLTAITPGHFLVGSALTAVPEPSLSNLPENRVSRWQLLQRMRDHFWERWSQEYLNSLRHRPKWCTRETRFEIGRLCLIRQETTPPTRWPLGRIILTHPGEDGQIRVVTVRTAASQFKRPITKLVLLPIVDPDKRMLE